MPATLLGALLGTLLATSAGLMGGCASLVAGQSATLRAGPPGDLPRRVELAGTPFFAQAEHHCGPAALAMALGAAGLPATPEALAPEVYLPAREGSLQAEMLAGARRRGALALRLPPTLEALLRETAAGHPVVVLLNLGLSWAPQWHYAVVVGYDIDAGELLLRSGPMRLQRLPLPTFELTWERAGHWAFVALPPGDLPVTASEADTVSALLAFERSAPPQAAARGWQAAATRWPGNLTLAMGLGNARHAAGDLDAAAAAFTAAAQSHDSAAAWNNLARVRLQQGRRTQALEAARRAVARATVAEPRWLAAAQATLAEIGPAP